jgi:hypothetical protein
MRNNSMSVAKNHVSEAHIAGMTVAYNHASERRKDCETVA